MQWYKYRHGASIASIESITRRLSRQSAEYADFERNRYQGSAGQDYSFQRSNATATGKPHVVITPLYNYLSRLKFIIAIKLNHRERQIVINGNRSFSDSEIQNNFLHKMHRLIPRVNLLHILVIQLPKLPLRSKRLTLAITSLPNDPTSPRINTRQRTVTSKRLHRAFCVSASSWIVSKIRRIFDTLLYIVSISRKVLPLDSGIFQ